MNAVSFGVGIGLLINATTTRDMLGGLFVMALAAAAEGAERFGDKRRARLRRAARRPVSWQDLGESR